ncbi:PDR/VanB family oxidoreductase [Corynebacterium pelargi]|uniref:Phthalate dioxygenase reductase n=1 Tax=Corynebacterium pelargi TaxID=1471400 RepID=A0A410W7N1_9CORY|nr:PDR/VanB family oxidoreductase [Corynebacterium pelargi]QAU51965.1 Phthalate dioxygenase reductase [Corynebacterium pelargi]GGG71112.1 hypothetical protein GCM10007338_05130 [Corynebacterium pelargi]
MKVTVSQIQHTGDIAIMSLQPKSGTTLAPYEPGAHIDITLDQGIIRQYSLCSADSNEYRIAVKLEPDSRGGSKALHQIKVGEELEISEPRNNFELDYHASFYVLIAAGVGIAPIYSMARSLKARGAKYTLLYFARSEEQAAFFDELAQEHQDALIPVFGSGRRDVQPALYRRLLSQSPDDTAVYVCGPTGFMDTARSVAAEFLAKERIHYEAFEADPEVLHRGETLSFVVKFEGETYEIPADQSVLSVFDAEDIPVLSSCEEGTCGNCVMRVVGGEPLHRDSVLSDQQHKDGYFATCVSRATSPELHLERINRRR